MARAEVIALFGPTGVGKTAVALALADRLRAAGEQPVAVSADALQVYQGLEILTGAATADERARLEHRLLSFLPLDATFSAGQYAELAHAEIDGLLDAGPPPDRRRGHRPVPPRRADGAEPATAAPRWASASGGCASSSDMGRRCSTPSSPGARRGRRRTSRPGTGSGSSARSSCTTPESSSRPPSSPSCGRTPPGERPCSWA